MAPGTWLTDLAFRPSKLKEKFRHGRKESAAASSDGKTVRSSKSMAMLGATSGKVSKNGPYKGVAGRRLALNLAAASTTFLASPGVPNSELEASQPDASDPEVAANNHTGIDYNDMNQVFAMLGEELPKIEAEEMQKNPNIDKELGPLLQALLTKPPEQSRRRYREIIGGDWRTENKEEAIAKLTPDNLPRNYTLFVRFRSAKTGLDLAEHLMVLVNGVQSLGAFYTLLQAEYTGKSEGVGMLIKETPRQWTYHSCIVRTVDNINPSDRQEFAWSCEHKDADEIYVKLAAFLCRRGGLEAETDVHAAKVRAKRLRGLKKSQSEYTVDGNKWWYPDLIVPNSVEVSGWIDILI